MKLLVITQKIDRQDRGVLGFFHGWVEEFAKHAEFVTVICLEKGEANLPDNVKVHSLGKESGRSRLKYISNFYKYIWRERKNYDTVFVHMNQEYVLLAGLLWRGMKKRVLMWRNHKMGSVFTTVSVWLCDRVFYTSPDSYTAKFKKSRSMPVGIDVERFKVDKGASRIPRSILSLGRIGKVKNVGHLVRALLILDMQGVDFTATIAGPVDEGAHEYKKELVEAGEPLVEQDKLRFQEGVPHTDTPVLYQSHEIFVNMTNSGSLDKTIFSAMSSGALVVVCNDYFRGVLSDRLIFKQGSAEDLALKLKDVLDLPEPEKRKLVSEMKNYVDENHSLEKLFEKLITEFHS